MNDKPETYVEALEQSRALADEIGFVRDDLALKEMLLRRLSQHVQSKYGEAIFEEYASEMRMLSGGA